MYFSWFLWHWKGLLEHFYSIHTIFLDFTQCIISSCGIENVYFAWNSFFLVASHVYTTFLSLWIIWEPFVCTLFCRHVEISATSCSCILGIFHKCCAILLYLCCIIKCHVGCLVLLLFVNYNFAKWVPLNDNNRISRILPHVCVPCCCTPFFLIICTLSWLLCSCCIISFMHYFVT